MANKVTKNTQYPVIAESDKWLARAEGLIPAYTQTLAKGPQQHVRGVAPKYLKKGKGARVWDVDGNEFLDYTMGVGPVLLGYAYDPVDNAIKEQLNDGITFSLMHPLEVEVAELMREMVPNTEMVRFSKTGADATTAAIRLARAFTGRSKILCCGYHGWHDWYIAVTDRNKGIPQAAQDLSFTIPYNDLKGVEEALTPDIAAIILEPTVFEEPKPGFLQGLRDLCDKNGTLLIFDEMWTGFRLAPGGAQEYFGVRADMATFSKAVANGMPISILTGRADVMKLLDKEVFFFTTFGGEALSLAACKATMNILKKGEVTKHIFKLGDQLRTSLNSLFTAHGIDYMKCIGIGPRSIVNIDGTKVNALEVKSLLQQELIRMGILWAGIHNMSYSHTEADIRYTLESYDEALAFVAKHVKEGTVAKALRGTPVEPVFRKTTQFHMKPKAPGATEGRA